MWNAAEARSSAVPVTIAYARKEPGPLHAKMRADRIAIELGNAYLRGEGIATDWPGGVMAFLQSTAGLPLPDIQLVFNAGSMTAHPYFPPFVPPYADSFSCRAVLLRPESRGQIELASSDPRIPVRIRLNFLATEKDWATLRAGVRLAREIGRQPALASLSAGEIAPGPDCQSDAELDAHIRATAITFHHPLGTCKMGRSNDPDAVVDPELRVPHGTSCADRPAVDRARKSGSQLTHRLREGDSNRRSPVRATTGGNARR
jgi:choline dehydrogenase/4-pyridoxate dehydrogenase